LTAADGARFNLLHHLLKPILPCSAPAVLAPALTNLFENFEEVLTYENDNEYGNTFSSEIWNMKAGGDEKLPICYLVLCAPHDMRERMVMLALQKGALFPVNAGEIKRYELEQVRLMGMITDAMKTSADKSWAIVKYAIIHADYELIRRVVTARLPIYMINPSSTASFFPYVAPLHLVVDLRYYVMSRTYSYMLMRCCRDPVDLQDDQVSVLTGSSDHNRRMRDPYNNDFTVLEKEAKEDPECLIHLAAQQEVKEEASKAIFDMLVGV